MKRAAVPSEHGNEKPLKKRTSSLFSMSTLQKSTEGPISVSDPAIGLDLSAKVEEEAVPPVIQTPKNISGVFIPPPPLSCTEDSSCGDDDEDAISLSISGTRQLSSSLGSSEPVVDAPPSRMAKDALTANLTIRDSLKNACGDLKTGLVFEEGSKHFDRHNRYHKERPIRVTSIMEALKKSEGDEWARCHVLGEESALPGAIMPTESATDFLDDDNYLRVHLPGYMKR